MNAITTTATGGMKRFTSWTTFVNDLLDIADLTEEGEKALLSLKVTHSCPNLVGHDQTAESLIAVEQVAPP